MMIKLPLAILGASTLLSLLAQAGEQIPTGIGEISNLSAIGALIWIVVNVLLKMHADNLEASERQMKLVVDVFRETIKERDGK